MIEKTVVVQEECVVPEEKVAPSLEVKLSPEVKAIDKIVYLVRLDNNDTRRGKETGELLLFKVEEEAKHALVSLADEEIRRIQDESPYAKVYRENVKDSSPYQKRIDVFVQEPGIIFTGTPVRICTFGYIPVSFGTYKDALLRTSDETSHSSEETESDEEN
jgi:hypothetical protein